MGEGLQAMGLVSGARRRTRRRPGATGGLVEPAAVPELAGGGDRVCRRLPAKLGYAGPWMAVEKRCQGEVVQVLAKGGDPGLRQGGALGFEGEGSHMGCGLGLVRGEPGL